MIKVCIQQVHAGRCIAVDPADAGSITELYAALPKFVFDKASRQQIVLRGLELPWRYNLYLQTGAFSLARQLGVERRRSISPDGLAEPSLLERLERVVLHNDGARMAQKPVADFAVLTLSRSRRKTMRLCKFRTKLFVALREAPLKFS